MNNNARFSVSSSSAYLWLLSLMAVIGWANASAATLAPGVQEKLVGATFEVVLAKPASDPLTYEKPLPLELLPFRERTDKFQSIGTAFAIGPNRFVSAAHVIDAGDGSQYGPLALRSAAGSIYRVDKIIKYSSSEDYAVFSVLAPPVVTPLETRSRPALNTPVFAVGNALGEGVVAREGSYTSDTPEEMDGRWQWIRFSAAASPGNSGGPLIDSDGKVIGVVLRKSPGENLNFALAIGQVLDGDEKYAIFEARSSYRILVMKTADSVSLHEKLELPKTLDEFYASSRRIAAAWAAKTHADFVKSHADMIFPAGNSDQLLATVQPAAFPKLIGQSDGGMWALVADTPRKVDLDKNGYLQQSAPDGLGLARLKAPDDVSEAELVADSKRFMDLMLRAYPISRPMGTDSVRVTSLGKASAESWFTDDYQRKWQIRQWLVPYNDTVLVTVALPTPDGMVMMISQAPTALREPVTEQLKALCDFIYVSYIGTLAQWHGFLADPLVLPATLTSVKLQFDFIRGLAIKSSRFQMLVPAPVVKLNAASVLMLNYSYIRDGTHTVWDLGGVYLSSTEANQIWVWMVRRTRPSPSMPDDITRNWRMMVLGINPWQGVPLNTAGGRLEINAMINRQKVASGKSDIGYTMTLNSEGSYPGRWMTKQFDALESGFTVIE